jgi:hypothetical protein
MTAIMIIAFVVGVWFGFGIAALMTAASNDDRRDE